MNTPHKVTIEITAKGRTTTVTDEGGNQVASVGMEMVSRGHAKGKTKQDIFDALGDEHNELAEAIDGNDPFGVAGALMDLE